MSMLAGYLPEMKLPTLAGLVALTAMIDADVSLRQPDGRWEYRSPERAAAIQPGEHSLRSSVRSMIDAPVGVV
jgi:hypothetical protein